MANIVYEHGELLVTVPVSQKIQVYSRDIVQIYTQAGFPNHPPTYNLLYTTQPDETFTSSAFSVETIVKLNAGATFALFAVGTSPAIPSSLASVMGTTNPFDITGLAADPGGAVRLIGGAGLTGANAGGTASVLGGAAGPTGVGGNVFLQGGAGGATSGVGGIADVRGGNATLNSNSGGVKIEAGLATGTGIVGSILLNQQAGTGPATVGIAKTGTVKTVSSTMTAAELKTCIITVNQGAGAASAQQLPTAAAMDTAFFDFAVNHTFEFAVINTSVVAAEVASITTNTGWTLVGAMDIPAYSAAGSLNSSATFWARKTGVATWTLIRV